MLVRHLIIGVVVLWVDLLWVVVTMEDPGVLNHLVDGTILDPLEDTDNKMGTMDLTEVMVDTTKIMFTIS